MASLHAVCLLIAALFAPVQAEDSGVAEDPKHLMRRGELHGAGFDTRTESVDVAKTHGDGQEHVNADAMAAQQREVFESVDKDHSGFLDPEEIHVLVQESPQSQDPKFDWRTFDADADGRWNVAEFSAAGNDDFQRRKELMDSEKSIFDILDLDHDNFLEQNEIKNLTVSFQAPENWWQEFDHNSDGKWDFQEFLHSGSKVPEFIEILQQQKAKMHPESLSEEFEESDDEDEDDEHGSSFEELGEDDDEEEHEEHEEHESHEDESESNEEVDSEIQAVFKAADKDNNACLDEHESKDLVLTDAALKFDKEANVNEDAKADKDAALKFIHDNWHKFDKHKNGCIDVHELEDMAHSLPREFVQQTAA